MIAEEQRGGSLWIALLKWNHLLKRAASILDRALPHVVPPTKVLLSKDDVGFMW